MPFARLYKIKRPNSPNIDTKSDTDTKDVGTERITLSPIRDLTSLVGGAVGQTVRVFDFHVENYKADIQHGDLLESVEYQNDEGNPQLFRVTDIRLHDTGKQLLVGTADLVR